LQNYKTVTIYRNR